MNYRLLMLKYVLNMGEERKYPLVLVPDLKPFIPNANIDSENILPYLANPLYLPVPEHRFSPQLSLPFISSYCRELHEETRDVYVYSEEYRSAMQEAVDMLLSYSESNPATLDDSDAIYKNTNIQGKSERSRTIYFDKKSQGVRASPIGFYEYSYGYIDIFEVHDGGGIPMLEVHTHPDDGLFSPNDYLRMLLRYFEEESRLVKGVVVLNPTHQLLAFATAQTPLIDPEPLKAMIDQWDDFSLFDDGSLDRLHKKFMEIYSELLESPINKLRSYQEQLLHILRAEVGIDLTSREIGIMMDKLQGEYDKEMEEYSLQEKEKHTLFVQSLQNWWDRFQFIGNQVFVAFAREIDVKLYISTNYCDFREFSA